MVKVFINLMILFFVTISSPSYSADISNKIVILKELQLIDADFDKLENFKDNNYISKVYAKNTLKGYAFITSNFSDSLGFSSAEFNILIYLSLKGKIIRAKLLSHSEPLFLYDKGEVRYEGKGIKENILYKFIQQYSDKKISKLTINIKENEKNIDGVSSATITSILMHQSILVATTKVLRFLGLYSNTNIALLDHTSFEPVKWNKMLLDGSISNIKLYYSDVISNKNREPAEDQNLFLDVYFAYANPVGIGQNIFGKTEFLKKFLRSGQDINDKGFFLATNGDFSLLAPRRCLNYKTTIDIKNCEKKGLAKTYFDRIYLEQNGLKFYFRTKDRKNFMFTRNIEDSTPRFFKEISLLFIDNTEKYDPAQKSTLFINYNTPDVTDENFISLDFQPPTRLIIEPNVMKEVTLNNISWLDVWKPQFLNIIILCIFVIFCSLILLFKNTLVKIRKLYVFIRFIALLFSLTWLGWTVGAQLTIVNIFNYIQLAYVSNFNYSVIVFDPLIVIISIVTFISFIILGRGFFCGWLCPFGALQEIINICSQKIGIIQIKIKDTLHRKLIYCKYIILFIILIFLFVDLDTALIMTEVEPFKTAITLKFIRDWPYVIYAILLLVASIYISRFYCRYICPLGAVLAIGGKFRILNILLRKKECGSSCHLCEKSCPTQAIKDNGEIDMNECFYCLDCQEEYYDAHRCPPLVAIRKKFIGKNNVSKFS